MLAQGETAGMSDPLEQATSLEDYGWDIGGGGWGATDLGPSWTGNAYVVD